MFFETSGYELQNSWEQNGESQKLTKDQIKNINYAVVKDKEIIDSNTGEPVIIKNIIFMMKSGKPRSFKLSPYNEQFKNGTRINLSSVELTEYVNQDGETKVTITCDRE